MVTKAVRELEERLLAFAGEYPEAWVDHPWGENVMKVKKKVFLFLGVPDERLTLSVKLPASGFEALLLPFTEPTGYGLGKSGWVTATFAEREEPPFGLLCAWIDESYRAVAPKTLVKVLDERGGGSPASRPVARPARKKAPARRKKA